MKVDVVEPCDDHPSSGLGLTGIVALVRSAAVRFPVASKGLLSIVDQAIVSGTSFLTAVIIGRLTSPGELGWYYLILGTLVIVSCSQDQLLTAPYAVYSKRRSGRDLAEYTGSVWAHQLLLTILALAGLIVVIALCGASGHKNVVPTLAALLIAGPLIMLRDNVRRFAFANLRVRYVIPLDISVAAVQLGGLACLAYFEVLTLVNIFAVMGASCGLACLGWYLFDPPRVRFVRERFVSDWRHNWAFGKWALRSYLVGNTSPQITLWILSVAVGTTATGVLGSCAILVGATSVILTGVSNVLTAQAAQAFAIGGTKDLRRILSRTAAFLVLTLGGFCMFVLLTGDWLAVVVFGDAYRGSGTILFLLALTNVLNSLGTVTGNGLWAIDQPRSNFVADVCCMSVTLIAAAFLILPFGALGAAVALLAGSSTAVVARTITLARHLERGALKSSVAVNSALSS